jgi:kinesin family protein 18/19
MIGTQTDPGIMVSVMEDLFVHSLHQGRQQGVQYKVSVSFLEVYNENIRDLLSDVEEYLDLREDPIKGPVVASITEIETTSGQEIMQLLHQGNAKRSQAATAANEVSSRSHAVLQVVVECRDRAPGTVANIKVGKLSLVDLAGSERAANTKNVGQRLVEGANINRSLLALGNCINALGEKGNKGNFVPYRDSKLTRLLKDSLGGNCRTVMIANISSAESSFEETLNTLKYANRAKNIKTNVQRNVLNVNYHISEYVELINNLRGEIQVLKSQISSGNSVERVATSHFPRDMGKANAKISSPGGPSNGQAAHLGGPSTPFQALRESLRSGAAGEGREIVNSMRQRIVDNFQEKMQLRRSLIELEDQNVQNSIEVSKRQLLIVQWSEKHGNFLKKSGISSLTKSDFAAYILANGSPEIIEAWQECEQLRKAIIKNNGMKKNIAKRLRHNERDAEKFREDLVTNVTGEDRRELMALQYQVGRLELENMELEQHRIVHESILKGKDLIIQKLKLQLAVRNKLINRQQVVLKEHNLDSKVGYDQLTLLEETLMGDMELGSTMVPLSPPRNMADILTPDISQEAHRRNFVSDSHVAIDKISLSAEKPVVPHLRISEPIVKDSSDEDEIEDEYEMAFTEREIALTARDRDLIEQGEWSEIQSELSDQSFSLGNRDMSTNHKRREKEFRQKEPQTDGKKLSFSKDSKVVSGPRGGRMYRASVNNDEGGFKKLEEKPVMGKILKTPSQYQNEEFSEEEMAPNAGIQGKYRHYASPRVKDTKSTATAISASEKGESMPTIYPALEENAANSRKTDKDSTPRSIFDSGNNRVGKEKEKIKELKPIAAIFPRKDDRNIAKQFEEDAADVLFSDNNDFDLVVKSKPLGKAQGKVLKTKASAPELPSKGSAQELPTVANNLDVVSALADLAINGDSVGGGRQVNRAKVIRQAKHSTKGAVIAPMENNIETVTVDDGPLGVRIKSLPVLNKHPSGSLPNSARDNLALQRS